MTPELLARMLREFLVETHSGVVIEDGQVVFELESARHAISAERGRCLLHLWSQERNIVREVVEAELNQGTLALSVRAFAKARPHRLEICRDRDRRSPAAKRDARRLYARLLERVLRRHAPDWNPGSRGLSTTMDLERTFSPVYARGLVRRGRSAFAVLGVSDQETQGAMDAALTFGLVWLQACREHEAGRSVVEGLRLYIPVRRSATLQIRLAQLNHDAAKFQLFELDERDEALTEIDPGDYGNIDTRLVHCPERDQACSRFAAAIARVRAQVPQMEVAVLSATEIAFRLHGLEFARARIANLPGTLEVREEIVFGVAGFEALLTDETESGFVEFLRTVTLVRKRDGDRRDPLWRMYPERWLEALVIQDVTALDPRLDAAHVYSQVPAFSAADRAMIDVLTVTRDRRLAVLELKADEDIHLPLQGLDYWARVLWHQQRREFQRFGYFRGLELAPRPPLLFLVAPSLRVHPAVDTVLRYFSPEIEWELAGVDERWRDGIKVIYRKSQLRGMNT
jgi:hypothetical protein